MFKRKIKTELEIFSEQRYRDTAVVIYHQLKKTKHEVPNEKPLKAPVLGWVDNTDTAPLKQPTDDVPNNKEIMEDASGQVQSKFCTLL